MPKVASHTNEEVLSPNYKSKVDVALERLLKDPSMVPGARLPTERALAEQLSVPRSAVRSALLRLQALNRVVRIIGSGTYIAGSDESHGSALPHKHDASPAEVMEARILLEPGLAGPVVAHGKGADLTRIRHAMEQARAATDFELFEYWDGEFHQAIADATHNRLLIDLYRSITMARDLAEWGELKRLSITEERRCIYNDEHAEIVAALQVRNAARAEEALRRHLLTVRNNLLGS